MNVTANHSNDLIKNKVSKSLEGMSIFEMTVWVHDYAEDLKWIWNYNKTKIDTRMQAVMSFSSFLRERFRDDPIATDEFRELCVGCVIDLETNCR